MNVADAKWRVLHFPQVPCEPFVVPCESFEDTQQISEVLALYDIHQFEHKIKPDYSNMTLTEVSHPDLDNGEWYNFDEEYDMDMFTW